MTLFLPAKYKVSQLEVLRENFKQYAEIVHEVYSSISKIVDANAG